MAQTSLIIGDTNWAVKEDSLLGYNVIQNKYLPIPIDTVRATTATRVNEQGLIEIVPRNLLTFSEQFDNANWGKINATVTTNTTTAPNGTLTADKLIATAINGTHLVLQIGAGAVLGQNLTLSVYAKSAGLTRLQFVNNGGGTGIASYNLTTGVATLSSGVSATMQEVENGWYRCVLTFAPNATGNYNIQIRLLDSAGNSTFTGNDVDGIFAWGAQIDNGSVATEYFPTTDRLDIPRIDYTTGSAALLVESGRTNLATYSEDFTDASWIKTATISANTTISPSGVQNADTFTDSTNAFLDVRKVLTITANSTNTASFFVKKTTGALTNYPGVAILLTGVATRVDYGIINTTTGAVIRDSSSNINSIAYSTQSYGDYWRVITTFTDNQSNLTCTFILYPAISSNGIIINSNAQGSNVFWGAQFEVGSYPTSYIPTVASTVTRNADVISRTGISGLIGQTEGTVFVDANLSVNANERRLITISNGNEIQRIFIWTIGTTLWVSFNSGSINLGNFPIGTAKIAVGYTISGLDTTYSIKVNNNSLVTGTTANAPNSLNTINLGSTAVGALQLNDRINSVQLYKTRLSNSELAQLTTL
jgi:hypothetical protein